MPFRRTIWMMALVAMVAASRADAADLAARGVAPSRLGAIFADAPLRRDEVLVAQRPSAVFVGTALKVPGYYGQPRDFEYRNYYGSSPIEIYSRLPYACGFVALC
jgi:hypothetical protein